MGLYLEILRVMVLVATFSNRQCLNCDKANITQGIWVLTFIIVVVVVHSVVFNSL